MSEYVTLPKSELQAALDALTACRQKIAYLLGNIEWYEPAQEIDFADISIKAISDRLAQQEAREIVYDTEAVDEVTHALTGNEGEEDSVTILKRMKHYVSDVWPGKTALEVLVEYEETSITQQEEKLRARLTQPSIDPCVDGSCDCCWTDNPQEENPEKVGSPCPEFWDWLPKAYGEREAFTKYNMEVAYLAGKQAQPQEKLDECEWPEEIMQQWDYWRHEIANGNCGSAPRDWFESLAGYFPTTPQPVFCEYCGGNDEDPQDHCMDCTRPIPVAWRHICNGCEQINTLPPKYYGDHWSSEPLYASPPQHEWQSLTDDEMRDLEKQFNAERVRTSDEEYLVIYPSDYWDWQNAIAAKLKEKNNG